jgi:hypothetical protein
MAQDAVIRNLEIIGEAAINIRTLDSDPSTLFHCRAPPKRSVGAMTRMFAKEYR